MLTVPVPPNPTAMQSWCYMYHLRITADWELMYHLHVNSRANEFSAFETEIKLLHTGVSRLLAAVGLPLHDILALGLRVDDESWDDPPATSAQGLEEARVILDGVDELVHHPDRRFIEVPGFGAMIEEQFSNLNWFSRAALEDLWSDEQRWRVRQASDDEHPGDGESEVGDEELDRDDSVGGVDGRREEETNDIAGFSESDEDQGGGGDPLTGMQGASEEQINELTMRTASAEDEGHCCIICLDYVVAGETLRVLPCSHSFHKHCVDDWLRSSATCPYDRSRVFRF